jgi:hypothetical protein
MADNEDGWRQDLRSRSLAISSIPFIPGIRWSTTKQLQSARSPASRGAAGIGAHRKPFQLQRKFQRAADCRIVVDDRDNGKSRSIEVTRTTVRHSHLDHLFMRLPRATVLI